MGILLALVWPRDRAARGACCRCSSCSASRRSSRASSSSGRWWTSTRRSTRAATSRPRSASPSSSRRSRIPERARSGARGRAAALDRRAELRHLPLALADHRADAAGRGHPVDGARRHRRAGGHRRRGRRRSRTATSSSRSGRGSLQRRLAQYSRRFRLEVVGAGAAGPRRGLRGALRDAELAESGRGLRQPAEGEGRHAPAADEHGAAPGSGHTGGHEAERNRPLCRRAGSSRSATP